MSSQPQNKMLQINISLPWYVQNLILIIAPISSIFLRFSTHFIDSIDEIYIQVSDISTVVLFSIAIFSYFNKKIEKYTPFLYFIYLLLLTVYVWFDFNQSDFQMIDILSFLILFFICNIFFSRYDFNIIYALTVLTLLGFSFIDRPEQKKYLVYISFAVFYCSVATIIVLFFKNKKVSHLQDYTNYLRKVLNHPGIGYALITFSDSDNQLNINDNNEKIFELLGIKKENDDALSRIISQGLDDRKINLLKHGEKLVSVVKNNKHLFEIHIDDINLVELKDHFLVRIYDITEERKSEMIALQRERKYKNLLEKNVAGVFTLDINGNLLEINNGMNQILNAHDIDKNDLNSFFKYTELGWEAIKKQVNSNGQVTTLDLAFNLPKNTLFLSINLYFDNETNYYEGTAIDVTKTEIANRKNKEKEQQFLQLFQESNDAILITEKGKIRNINNTGKQLLNLNERIIDKSIWDFLKLDQDIEKLKGEINGVQGHYKKLFFECELIVDAKMILAELSISVISLENKTIEQIIIRDISERRNYENQIINHQKILQNTLENIPESVIVFNKEKIIFANSEVYKLLNIKDKKIQNIQLNQLFKGQNEALLQQILKIHLEKQVNINGQLEYNNNQTIDYSVVKTIFNNEQHAILILKDITHISKLEKERIRAEIAEKSSNELKKEIKERKIIEQKLEEQTKLLNAIIENTSNTLIWSVNNKLELISFNSQFKKEMEIYMPDEIKLGMNVIDILKINMSEKGLRDTIKVFKKVARGKTQVIEGCLYKKNSSVKHWFETFLGPIFDAEGNITQITCVSHNITEKKQINTKLIRSLEEKEILLKEVHHRVKNNLQVVSSILNLQSSYIKDPNVLDALSESQNRIKSMSLIHESLYQNKDFASVDLSEYIKNLVSNLVHTYRVYDVKISYNFDFEGIKLELDLAIPCGLIINEIISNTLKYAFFDRETGIISLSIKKEKNKYRMEIADNGIGLPENFDLEKTDTLGMQLISSLVQQVNGTMELINERGTKYLIIFGN